MNTNPTVLTMECTEGVREMTTTPAVTTNRPLVPNHAISPDSSARRDGFPRREALIQMALETAEAATLHAPPESELVQPNSARRLTLALLIYSYTNKTYASEDVEWTVESDPVLHGVFGSAGVEDYALRRFRRDHRPWIEACLAELLWRQTEAAQGRVWESRRAPSLSAPELDTPFRLEAHRRVDLAVLMDMAMSE